MKIETYRSNITRIAGLIRAYDNLAGNEVVPVRVSSQHSDLIITKFRISEDFSNFDLDVADAIYTMYINECKSFTPGQLLRVLSGDNRQTITDNRNKDEIIESIKKLRRTTIEISCEAEMESHGNGVVHLPESEFLKVERLTADHKYKLPLHTEYPHANIDKYPIFFMPLYGYAELTGQICSFSQAHLYDNRPERRLKIQNSIENIQIKRYLIRRIERMNNAQRRISEEKEGLRVMHPGARKTAYLTQDSTHVSYKYDAKKEGLSSTGLLPTLGILEENYTSKDAWRHKRHSVHNTALKILDYYIEIGYIERYEIVFDNTDKRRISGVIIFSK
ncbi:hypothetical protein LJC34_01945 [Oscillospiraceae bacterium OttesenSCG-928-G22]|nr:hypothetical protein [Oscillospiraceae bacterium OttesenSCG-928-G22]